MFDQIKYSHFIVDDVCYFDQKPKRIVHNVFECRQSQFNKVQGAKQHFLSSTE